MATGTDRRLTRDGRPGDHGASDAISDRCWRISYLSPEYPDAVSREQLHRAAGEEQQACRTCSLRYDSRSQLLDAIPAPIITHFLKEADSQNYRGFPSAGFSFFPTRDPALREFAGEKGKGGGVYVTNVEPKTPAMKAGLQVGDIVTAVADREIDQNGNYLDPLYGKIEFTNLLTAHAYSGDVVPFRVERNGKPIQLNLYTRASGRERLCQPAVQSR